MESIKTIANDFYSLTIVAKLSLLDVCKGSGYTSAKENQFSFTSMKFYLNK